MVNSPAGEDDIARCPNGDYAANTEKATSQLPAVADEPWEGRPEKFPTPGIRTIAELATAFDFASGDRQIKSLVYVIDGEPALVLLRGDHELMEQKLIDGVGTQDVRPAHAEEIQAALGADAGSLGAVGVSSMSIIADPALTGRSNMVTGANENDFHLRGVAVDRDIDVDRWLDVRKVEAGDACPVCGAAMSIERSIEIGHIFKLGTKYSDALGATVLDEDGKPRPIVMGSYGIGVGRNLASVVETHHDDKGIIWPVSIAPWEAVITVVKMNDVDTVAAAESLYSELGARGVEVILDDRVERPGVKFNDAELIGIPFRITVGPRGLADGVVEVTERASGDRSDVAVGEAAATVAERVLAARG
jgi:prolyl-tRNA synthetase